MAWGEIPDDRLQSKVQPGNIYTVTETIRNRTGLKHAITVLSAVDQRWKHVIIRAYKGLDALGSVADREEQMIHQITAAHQTKYPKRGHRYFPKFIERIIDPENDASYSVSETIASSNGMGQTVDGSNLDEAVRRIEDYAQRRFASEKPSGAPLTVGELVRPIVRGLIPIVRLHQLGFIHGDVKPSNIVLKWKNIPKPNRWYLSDGYVVDFETTHKIGEDVHAPTGTPGYSDPNLLNATKQSPIKADPRSDVYAAAASILALLAQQADLYEDVSRSYAVPYAQSQRAPKVLGKFGRIINESGDQTLHPEIATLMGVLTRALSPHIEGRPTMTELMSALVPLRNSKLSLWDLR